MGELTQEEMGRLRVRLADLPGFDPVGLTAHVDASGRSDDHRLGVYVPGGPGRDTGVSGIPPYHWVWHGEDLYDPDVWCMSTVSTADARTRDALARWAAEREGVEVGLCAPAFFAKYHNDGRPKWLLKGAHASLRIYVAEMPPGLDPGDVAHHWRAVPGPARAWLARQEARRG